MGKPEVRLCELLCDVRTLSDRITTLKLEIEGVMLNAVSVRARNLAYQRKRNSFQWKVDRVVESVATGE